MRALSAGSKVVEGLSASEARAALEAQIGELRPKLHRYCARMTGSVIDGEDVVQEALAKALAALTKTSSLSNVEGWLFRIAHNAALDFLRRRARLDAVRSGEDPEMIPDPASAGDEWEIISTSLRTFMRLPVPQRSSIILKDVLGYSLEEVAAILDGNIPAVKSILHRGRTRLRELAQEPESVAPPVLAEPERSLLAAYIDRFNARDFQAILNMVADEVRLEVVNKTRMRGRHEVANYFHNYSGLDDWHFAPGLVERRPAVLVTPPGQPSGDPMYFVLLEWSGHHVVDIRDFRYARYVTDGAEMISEQ